MRIRSGDPTDVPDVLAMVHELATYERAPDAVTMDAAALSRAAFGPTPAAWILVADPAGAGGSAGAPQPLAGFALSYRTFSTWTGRVGIYLEDLFVRPAWRRQGVGQALLARLAADARRAGAARLEWAVLDWNAPAIAFYEHLGARALTEWVSYRIEGATLDELAASWRARPAADPCTPTTGIPYPGCL